MKGGYTLSSWWVTLVHYILGSWFFWLIFWHLDSKTPYASYSKLAHLSAEPLPKTSKSHVMWYLWTLKWNSLFPGVFFSLGLQRSEWATGHLPCCCCCLRFNVLFSSGSVRQMIAHAETWTHSLQKKDNISTHCIVYCGTKKKPRPQQDEFDYGSANIIIEDWVTGEHWRTDQKPSISSIYCHLPAIWWFTYRWFMQFANFYDQTYT